MIKKRNLTKEKIITTVLILAQEIGLHHVSFPRIAERLEIKPPSLYNHFKNMDDVKVATAIYLYKELNTQLEAAIEKKKGAEAIQLYAHVYRDFAYENYAVYELLNWMPSPRNNDLLTVARESLHIIKDLIAEQVSNQKRLLIMSRIFRSQLHGFITLKQLGYFQKAEVSDEETFETMIAEYIIQLGRKE